MCICARKSNNLVCFVVVGFLLFVINVCVAGSWCSLLLALIVSQVVFLGFFVSGLGFGSGLRNDGCWVLACALIFDLLLLPEAESSNQDYHHNEGNGKDNDKCAHVRIVSWLLFKRPNVVRNFTDFTFGILSDCGDLLEKELSTDTLKSNWDLAFVKVDNTRVSASSTFFENLSGAGSQFCGANSRSHIFVREFDPLKVLAIRVVKRKGLAVVGRGAI
jgi:hypothetical protein